MVGAATLALVSLVVGDEDVEAVSVTSTTPERPGTTVLVPGGRVLLPPGGSDPALPGTVPSTTRPTLPEGWPEGLAPPEGSDFLAATTDGPTGRQLVVNYGSDVEGGALADLLDAQLKAAGFTITGGYRDPDGRASSIQATSSDFEANVSVTDASPASSLPRAVTIVLRPTS